MAINALPQGYLLNNDYKILQTLGQGGFGITYLAEDTSLGHQVVIKEFLPQSMAVRDQSHYTVSPYSQGDAVYGHLLKRFVEEARLLAGLRHPSIVKVTRLLDANDTAYFVMDYEEGETLEDYLQRSSVVKEEDILAIMMPILEGAKYVHGKGVLHRDIAPDNIYLKTNGMPMLIDFGAARNAIAQQSQKLSAISKDGYSPPEQYTPNTDQNAATDIYALGAVFYRMITGNKPPNASQRQMALLKGEGDPIGDVVVNYKGKYSASLLQAVSKALDIHQERRFQTIMEFQEAIYKGVVPQQDGNSKGQPGGSTPGNGNKGLVAGLIVALFVVVGAAGYLIVNGEKSVHPASEPVKVVSPITTPTMDSSVNEIKKAEAKRKEKEAERLYQEKIQSEKKELEALQKEKEKRENELVFNQENIKKFLEDFVASGEDNSAEKVLPYYAHTVKPYFGLRSASREVIYEDKVKYYKRWPHRKYKVLNFTILDTYVKDGDEYCNLSKTISWETSSSSSSKSGVSVVLLTLKKSNNRFQITAIKGMKKDPQTNNESISELLKQAKAHYYGSTTISKDYIKAKEYFLKAARQNSVEAYRYLGTIYLFGHGAPVDKYEAKKWLKKAIGQGDVRAEEIYDKYIKVSSQDNNYKKFKVINVASNDTLNVRTDPYVGPNNKVGELQPYAKNIRVLESKINQKGTKWSRIKYNKGSYTLSGWVVSRCLAPESMSYTSSKRYKVINIRSDDTLSVRKGAGSEYYKIGDLPYYARNVKILTCRNSSKGGNWCSVKYGTVEGWVSAMYLQEQ